jgi:hypothetical protein
MGSIVTNTFLTPDAVGNREDLEDIIYDISPTKTPFMANAGRGTCKAVLHEWQMDELASAADNKKLQGAEAEFGAVVPTVRVGNYTQIADKAVIVSGTQEKVDKAGRSSEVGYQLAKLGKEIKRDMEFTLVGTNKGAVGAATATEPELASLPAWIKTNTVFGVGGSDPVWTSGVPAAGRTDGTQAAFTVDMLKEAMADCFASGAEPTTLSVGPFNKQVVSGFTGISTLQYQLNAPSQTSAIIAAVDVIKTDFGLLSVVPNRFQRERDALLLDFDYVSVNYLRPFEQEELAKTGDGIKRVMRVEYTLEVKNEKALGGIFDLATS